MSKSVVEWCCMGPDFGCCFSAFWYDKNRWPNGGIRGLILSAGNKIETYFRAQICSFVLGYFYYKYKPCIRVNLEIEGVENKGLETNNKVGFYRAFSRRETLG